MVDFHTHILPNIDDGANSLEESLALIDSLQSQGVTDIVLSPHFYPDQQSCEQFLDSRDESFKILLDNYKSENKVNLFLGAEVYCNEYLLIARNLHPLCIKGTSLMLLELPLSKKLPNEVWNIISKLSSHHGITPVIAHADRYPFVMKSPISTLKKLIEYGCIIQFGCDAFTSKSDLCKILECVDAGKVHVIGSDCHNTRLRPPRYKIACDVISSNLGIDKLTKLESNAKRLLEGKSLKSRNLFF